MNINLSGSVAARLLILLTSKYSKSRVDPKTRFSPASINMNSPYLIQTLAEEISKNISSNPDNELIIAAQSYVGWCFSTGRQPISKMMEVSKSVVIKSSPYSREQNLRSNLRYATGDDRNDILMELDTIKNPL